MASGTAPGAIHYRELMILAGTRGSVWSCIVIVALDRGMPTQVIC